MRSEEGEHQHRRGDHQERGARRDVRRRAPREARSYSSLEAASLIGGRPRPRASQRRTRLASARGPGRRRPRTDWSSSCARRRRAQYVAPARVTPTTIRTSCRSGCSRGVRRGGGRVVGHRSSASGGSTSRSTTAAQPVTSGPGDRRRARPPTGRRSGRSCSTGVSEPAADASSSPIARRAPARGARAPRCRPARRAGPAGPSRVGDVRSISRTAAASAGSTSGSRTGHRRLGHRSVGSLASWSAAQASIADFARARRCRP